MPTQPTADGLLALAPDRQVPGLGWSFLVAVGGDRSEPVSGAAVRAEGNDGGAVVENDLLRVEVGSDGTLRRVLDKRSARDALDGRGNQLWASVDRPRTYDAWDIAETYERDGEEIGGVERIEVEEQGPLRAAVRVERRWRGSRIVQTYRLLADSKRIDIVTFIDWHERQVLLKARVPLAVRTHEATYETMYGAVRRPTHRNTSWDAARFEVAGHRFADLSEPGFGVALLNDAKYGHDAHDNVLSLSLVRGPVYPDPYADEGEHRFTYGLLPHLGDWTEAGVVTEALALNSPLRAVPAAPTGGSLPAVWGLVRVDGLAVGAGAVKRAEEGDGIIVRLYEPHGARGTMALRFAQPVRKVERINLLEEPATDGTPPEVEPDGVVRLAVRPFEVVSLRVVI